MTQISLFMLTVFRVAAGLFALMLLACSSVVVAQPDGGDDQNPNEIGQDNNPISTALPFLTVTPDARAAAMGEAGVASTPDMASVHHNVAKLAFMEDDFGFIVSYTPWLRKIVNDMSISYVGGYMKLDERQTIAISLRYFDLGSIQFTDNSGAVIQDFRPNEWAADVSYARQLSERLSIGGALRFGYSNLSGNFSNAVSTTNANPINTGMADVGLFYTNPEPVIFGKSATWNWGIAINNIGPKVTYTTEDQEQFIPTTLKLGTSIDAELDPFNSLAINFDINKLMVPTPQPDGSERDQGFIGGMFSSFGDAPDGFSEELQELIFSLGAEYGYNDQVFARAGYFYESEEKGNRNYMTLGLGVSFSVMTLDFAYLVAFERDHPLADTLRFTLRGRLNKGGNDGNN